MAADTQARIDPSTLTSTQEVFHALAQGQITQADAQMRMDALVQAAREAKPEAEPDFTPTLTYVMREPGYSARGDGSFQIQQHKLELVWQLTRTGKPKSVMLSREQVRLLAQGAQALADAYDAWPDA